MKKIEEIVTGFVEMHLEDTTVLALVSSNKMVGMVTYSKKDKKLYSLMVDVDQRNCGHGTLILKEAIKRYKPEFISASNCFGCDPVKLMKLYSSVGFQAYNIDMARKMPKLTK